MKREILITNGLCPHCGAKITALGTDYYPNEIRYGSPIRKCKKCSNEYLDKRYHEAAIEVPTREFSVKKDILCILLGLFIAAISICVVYYQIKYSGRYSMRMYFLRYIGAMSFFAGIIDIVMIKTGIKGKIVNKKIKQSEERLSNVEYAMELAELGYNVPNRFL